MHSVHLFYIYPELARCRKLLLGTVVLGETKDRNSTKRQNRWKDIDYISCHHWDSRSMTWHLPVNLFTCEDSATLSHHIPVVRRLCFLGYTAFLLIWLISREYANIFKWGHKMPSLIVAKLPYNWYHPSSKVINLVAFVMEGTTY